MFNQNKVISNIFLFLFCIAICLSLFSVIYLLKYDILTQHDLVFSYGRKFLEPEHGRYLAHLVNSLLTEVIPEYINIHPNDLQPIVLAPLKGICVILSCLFISNSAFLFSKNPNLNREKISNPSFITLYILVFLSLFNVNYFFYDQYSEYYNISENIVFFEYSMSILLYVLLFSFAAYYYINEKFKITPPQQLIISVIAFLTGTSVDPVNVPSLFILILFGIILLIQFHKTLNKTVIYNILKVYSAYILGIICYFIRPLHHHPDYHNLTLIQYVKEYFPDFLSNYIKTFLSKESLILIPIIFAVIVLIFMKNFEKSKKNVLIFSSLNILSFVIFYFFIFLLGFYANDFFWFNCSKWINIYKVICLFHLLLIVGYILDCNKYLTSKKSLLIKIGLCIFTMIIFSKNLIIDYIPNIRHYSQENKELRKVAYIIEKLAMTQKNDVITIPEKYAQREYSFPLFLEEKECSFYVYITNVHPEIHKTGFIYDDSKVNLSIFSDEELELLKFQNLINGRMYRHKKVIKNCY